MKMNRLTKNILTMGRFVNPFTDVGFKVIFGSELSKDMLIFFLSGLLEGEYEVIDLTFLDKEDHGGNVNDRGIVYDIYCRTSDGKYIIVEMQNRWHSHFLDRTLYYVCRGISRQIYLQFPYFTKELHECDTLFEKWLYTLKHMDKWDRMPNAQKEQVFQRLAE